MMLRSWLMRKHRRWFLCYRKDTENSFRFLISLGGTGLRASWNLVVGWPILVLTMWLKILVVVVIAVRVVITMLRAELMHLLWAGSKLIWSTVSSTSHWH